MARVPLKYADKGPPLTCTMATGVPGCPTWYQRLPKLELHAHLNGCVRDCTLQSIISSKGDSIAPLTERQAAILQSKGCRSLEDCFQFFDIIHKVTTDHESITRITEEVIRDFEADGVVYLELRTTPKDRLEYGMTKRSYMEAVLKGLRNAIGPEILHSVDVRLLLSIDRRETAAQAMETVELAASMKEHGVAGIDLSGNPSIGHWSSWEAALQHARQLGLRVTLHGGEVDAPEEVAAMLDFKPDRLGHMVFLTKEHEERLMASGIPVELCLTSNLKSSSVNSIPDHHFKRFRQAGCPVVLCTDDSGLFGTTLSQEFELAASAFELTGSDMKDLVRKSVSMIFADDICKENVRAKVEARLANM